MFDSKELEKEIWKDIPNYEGMYQVSDLGRVKSLSRKMLKRGKYPFISKEKILKQSTDTKGYYKVDLHNEKKIKTCNIGQLVAIVFLKHIPCGNSIEVKYIDGNKTNNRLHNLEIVASGDYAKNKFQNKTSKYVGVYFDKNTNKWRAQISINKKRKHIGLFNTELEAQEAIKKALK